MKLLQVVFCLVLLVGCQNTTKRERVDDKDSKVQREIIISAAASLKDVMEVIKALYKKQYPQTIITYNFAASGTLQRQIEQGAPIDLFISADRSKIDILEQKDLLKPKTVRDVLQNQMVLVAKRNNSFSSKTFSDLTKPEIKIVALGEPNSVPAGKYAQEVLNYFQLARQIADKTVYGKDVRQVLSYVVTGNADLGIVYLTDASVNRKIEIIAIAPTESHSTINYAIAVVRDSQNPQAATQFIRFLETSEVQKLFVEYRFTTINHK